MYTLSGPGAYVYTSVCLSAFGPVTVLYRQTLHTDIITSVPIFRCVLNVCVICAYAYYS